MLVLEKVGAEGGGGGYVSTLNHGIAPSTLHTLAP